MGAQGTVCAGGRYDGLVAQLGGKATPAVGFAMGLERLVLLVSDNEQAQGLTSAPDVFVMSEDPMAALLLAEQLRNQAPQVRTYCHCGGGKLKKLIKKAGDSGAQVALILGPDEIANQQVSIKPLRDDRPQATISQQELSAQIFTYLPNQE